MPRKQPMKQSFIFGGLFGFALCFLSALSAGSDADGALLEAVLCGLIAAMLFRWLHGLTSRQLTAVEREREAAAAAEATAAAVAGTDSTPGQAAPATA